MVTNIQRSENHNDICKFERIIKYTTRILNIILNWVLK